MALSRFAVLVAVVLATPGALTWSDEQPPDAPPAPVVAHFPWTGADAPPTVAGLHLGDTRATVEAALGAATQLRPMGSGLALEYTSQGLSIVLGAKGDVSMIYLLSRTAGSIDGVRVGDSRQEVLAHWGVPPLVQGAQAMYPAGDWAVVAELGPEQRVLTLSLGRAYGNTELR